MAIRRNSAGARYVYRQLHKLTDERRERMYLLVRRWKSEGLSDAEIIRRGRLMI